MRAKFLFFVLMLLSYILVLFVLETVEFKAQADTVSSAEMYPKAPYVRADVIRQHSQAKPVYTSPVVGDASVTPFQTYRSSALNDVHRTQGYASVNAPYAMRVKQSTEVPQSFNYVMPLRPVAQAKGMVTDQQMNYSFDDNNAFAQRFARKSAQADIPMINPDNPDDEVLNPLPLSGDVFVLLTLMCMYIVLRSMREWRKKRKVVAVYRSNGIGIKSLRRLSIVFVLLTIHSAMLSNNLRISKLSVEAKDTLAKTRDIRFDIAWDNSWRVNEGPANYDAAWVFMKYSTDQGMTWKHAHLSNAANVSGTGTAAQMVSGLLNPSAAYHQQNNPVLGVFVQRASMGTGVFTNAGARLRWNYGDNGVLNTEHVMLKVFAIEMVYVTQGSFYVGDGSETKVAGNLSDASNKKQPFRITSEEVITLGGTARGNLGSNERQGMLPEAPDDFSSSSTKLLPKAYPKGFNGFYMMKYELTQQQYVDFLNTLTRVQQNERTFTDLAPGVTAITNRYVMSNTPVMKYRNSIRCDATISATAPIRFYCDANGNGIGGEEADGQAVACNFINWPDGLAFADWAGLRPMTELEFTKASRGPVLPVKGEYSWGTSHVSEMKLSLINKSTASERIAVGFNTINGNAVYNQSFAEPVKVGVFAASIANNGRVTAGASFYGIMELSGNLWERTVMLGAESGRNFTGVHGNGMLSERGNANQAFWPGTQNAEVKEEKGGFRGGALEHAAERMRVSDRNSASLFSSTVRYQTRGFRAVRSIKID